MELAGFATQKTFKLHKRKNTWVYKKVDLKDVRKNDQFAQRCDFNWKLNSQDMHFGFYFHLPIKYDQLVENRKSLEIAQRNWLGCYKIDWPSQWICYEI